MGQTRKIIIIHSSVVIARGLKDLLKDLPDTRFMVATGPEMIGKDICTGGKETIFIVEEPFIEGLKKQCGNIVEKRMIPFGSSGNPEWLNENMTEEEIVNRIAGCFRKESKTEETESQVLSPREKEILRHVALGLSNKEIADRLFISTHTVISHRKNITEKLGIKSISGLTLYAFLNRIIDPDQLSQTDLI